MNTPASGAAHHQLAAFGVAHIRRRPEPFYLKRAKPSFALLPLAERQKYRTTPAPRCAPCRWHFVSIAALRRMPRVARHALRSGAMR